MNKYDIKHPMRGEEYSDYRVMKPTFKHKILAEAQAESSFLTYKYDHRKAMDYSAGHAAMARCSQKFEAPNAHCPTRSHAHGSTLKCKHRWC